MLPTKDRIDVCRLLSTSLTEHGQFMSFFRSRPGIAEMLRTPDGRAILLLEPGFDAKNDWVLSSKWSNPTGQADDGEFYAALLVGTNPAEPEKHMVSARHLSMPETGGYVRRVDICQRLKSYDGSISSVHFSRKGVAEFVRPVYSRHVVILGSNFDDKKDWVLAGLSEGSAGCKRDQIGSCLAGNVPGDFESATDALQAIKRYLKLCGDAGHPHSVAC